MSEEHGDETDDRVDVLSQGIFEHVLVKGRVRYPTEINIHQRNPSTVCAGYDLLFHGVGRVESLQHQFIHAINEAHCLLKVRLHHVFQRSKVLLVPLVRLW